MNPYNKLPISYFKLNYYFINLFQLSLLDNVDFVNGFLLFGFHLCIRLLYNAKEKGFEKETNEESQSVTVKLNSDKLKWPIRVMLLTLKYRINVVLYNLFSSLRLPVLAS